jgi:membrane fusion protein, copper/silver efflux system
VPVPATGVGGPAGKRRIAFYRSPHDPKQTSPTPRKDEMGMDYLPVYQDELGGASASVPGLVTVQIDPQRQQLIGLRTAKATRGAVTGSWRTAGRVAIDETRVHHINVKVDGFVEHVHVDFTGMTVKQGDPLFSLYSPELVSAQSEYLLALRTRSALASTSAARDGDDLVESARQRLRYWDIPDSTVAELERTGRPQKTLTFYSPISGVVTKKDVVHGHKLSAGDMPYEVTNLSNVWVLADVYESEIARVKVGMPAALTLKAYPNRRFKGRVIFVDPLLDPGTRTAKVRLSFANPTGELRPELFGEVELFTPAREGVSIPSDAVVDSGTKTVVFVSLGDGKFQPREVQIGQQSGERTEVISGLRDGEEVVTRANFLVDSESRLRASLAAMGAK